MTRPQILINAPLRPIVAATLEQSLTVHRLWEQADPDDFLTRHGGEIRGLAASTLAGPVDAALLDRLPALEMIASFGVGYDHIDARDAARRGIIVTNTPGVLDDEVADLTIGLLIATLRQIPQAEHFLRAGKWREGMFPLSPSLRGRTIGILGLGNIGKAIAHRLEAFGVGLHYHGRDAQAGVAYPYHPTPVALAAAVDVLIAITPGGNETRHLVDAEVLKALGGDGVLINVARGSVVDEAALIAALGDGTILAAGLDVYENEPEVPQALLDLPNAVLLPHIASGSIVTRDAMGKLVADNLIAWFERGEAITPVPESAELAVSKGPNTP
jgi:lactate dehydrogenase-like 2-hydroxyacid dehydrogenase